MAVLAVLLLAAAVAFLVYALWPRQHTQFSYTVGDDNPVKALYARSAHGWFEKWNQRWEYTGARPSNPKLIGTVMAAAIVVGFVLVLLMARNPVVALVVAAGVGLGPWTFLGSQSAKRETVITSQLVDFLDSVRSSLESDTVEVAIRRAATSVDAPLKHELAGLVADLDARVNLSTSLQHLARRNSSRSMAFSCATLDMAKRTGSAEITTNLNELAKLIRNNERTAADIKNKTLILRVCTKLFVIVPAVTLAFSMMSFGVQPWMTTIGTIALVAMAVIAAGASYGFRRLQQWQVGL